MDSFEQNIIEFNKQLSIDAVQYFNCQKLVGQKPDAIVICGMGGSGLAGRILQSIASEINLLAPIITWSDYELPKHAFKNPLLIFISFSGNTAETLSNFHASSANNLRAVISTGGRLKILAEKEELPLAVFPAGTLQPRQATGYSFYALLGLLKNIFPETQIINLDKHFDPFKNRLQGEELAQEIDKKIIMIYTSSNNSHLAYNWKDRINETGKALSFFNVIPEMCHNEIVSFESRPQNVICLFLNDPDDHPENKRRINFVSHLLQERNIESIHLNLSGNNIFEKIWQSINLADWLAFYLASKNGFDPTDTKIIDQLKKLMA